MKQLFRFGEVEKMQISIIIPTFNEGEYIASLVSFLWKNNPEDLIREVIVADGGSRDNTREEAEAAGAKFVNCPRKGRATQMNCGAAAAKGDILYFLHADSLPPETYSKDIHHAVQNGFQSGCYQLNFDHKHWFLQMNSWFTRFDVNAVRFGDQSLFVTKEAFRFAGGFNEKLHVMEDQEIIKRIKRYARFMILDNSVTTSARKYLQNGVFRLQGLFFLVWLCYQLGIPQDKLQKLYKLLIREHKM